MEDDRLNTIANIAQLYSLCLLLVDNSNNQIMRELQHQNTDYLEEILKRIDKLEKTIENMKK